MARSRGSKGAAPPPSSRGGGPNLLDLPCALLEAIILLLPLKLRWATTIAAGVGTAARPVSHLIGAAAAQTDSPAKPVPLHHCCSVRFSTTCGAAHQLVSSSPCLFPTVTATCRSRMQSLALLRWLGSGCHSIADMELGLSVQHVPIVRQLGQGLGMQGAGLGQLSLRQVNEAGGLGLPSSSSARRFSLQPLTAVFAI